tara:strand:- start:3880 stop:4545 length:666 start_codon:yes stop_codon:yes gene_type:complete
MTDTEELNTNNQDENGSPEPSHMMLGEYVVLMETNGHECESWYYFIRKQGNETNLKYLEDQLNKVDWYMEDDLSIFDLDLEHTVTAKTAKQMTKLELNSYQFHRKFDGKLKHIDLGFKKKDKNVRMMEKTFDVLGYGQIEDYISDEDIDPEDLTDNESESDSNTDSGSESGSGSDSESESETEKESAKVKDTSRKGIPPALLNSDRPNWAKAKGKRQQRKR